MLTLLRKIFLKFAFIIEKIQQRIPNKSKNDENAIQRLRTEKWVKDKGDELLRFDYLLQESSIVFDVGGYHGEFARDIYCKYNSTIYVFEPIGIFYNEIVNRFIKNDKIRVFNFGLGSKSSMEKIGLEENASSLYIKSQKYAVIEICSFNDFIELQNISKIDLLKLNIEGGEYDLLESIIHAGNMNKIINLQVQFHDFIIENAKERMDKIYEKLSETHQLTWHYEFVWDNWELKNNHSPEIVTNGFNK